MSPINPAWLIPHAGYRLLERDEEIKDEDEYWDIHFRVWKPLHGNWSNLGHTWSAWKYAPMRRRIEKPNLSEGF